MIVSQVQQMQQLLSNVDMVEKQNMARKLDDTQSFVKKQSSNVVFELGAMKVSFHKENESQLLETHSDEKMSVMSSELMKVAEEMKQEKTQMMEMSPKQQKVMNMFSQKSGGHFHIDA